MKGLNKELDDSEPRVLSSAPPVDSEIYARGPDAGYSFHRPFSMLTFAFLGGRDESRPYGIFKGQFFRVLDAGNQCLLLVNFPLRFHSIKNSFNLLPCLIWVYPLDPLKLLMQFPED